MNSCGTCTLCCKLTEVPETGKPAGEWCLQCNVGHGCQSYSDRPESCKSFQCLWLSEEMDGDLRPDVSKIVFERLPGRNIVLALLARDQSWNTKHNAKAILGFVRRGLSVVTSGSERMIFTPQDVTENMVVHELRAAKGI